MKRAFLYMLLGSLLSCSSLPRQYTALNDSATFSLDRILQQIERENVIFVGEIHGTKSHHLVQLEVIKHFHERGNQVAVALEIFPSGKQAILNRWTQRYISDYQFKRVYDEIWGIAYDSYRDIFEYARDHGIHLIGINAEPALISDVSKNGMQGVSEDLLKEVKFSDCSMDAEYAELFGFSGDREYHVSGMPFLCDGQRLRDAIMASNIAGILKQYDCTIVVLVGVAHASKVAVPRMLENHFDVDYKVLLPKDIEYLIRREPDRSIADYVW